MKTWPSALKLLTVFVLASLVGACDQRDADVRVELERPEHRQVLGIDGRPREQLVRNVRHHVGLARAQDGR